MSLSLGPTCLSTNYSKRSHFATHLETRREGTDSGHEAGRHCHSGGSTKGLAKKTLHLPIISSSRSPQFQRFTKLFVAGKGCESCCTVIQMIHEYQRLHGWEEWNRGTHFVMTHKQRTQQEQLSALKETHYNNGDHAERRNRANQHLSQKGVRRDTLLEVRQVLHANALELLRNGLVTASRAQKTILAHRNRRRIQISLSLPLLSYFASRRIRPPTSHSHQYPASPSWEYLHATRLSPLPCRLKYCTCWKHPSGITNSANFALSVNENDSASSNCPGCRLSVFRRFRSAHHPLHATHSKYPHASPPPDIPRRTPATSDANSPPRRPSTACRSHQPPAAAQDTPRG